MEGNSSSTNQEELSEQESIVGTGSSSAKEETSADTKSTPGLHRAGQWAIIAGVMAIVGLIALITFFAVGGPFGMANDILAIPGFIVLIPVAFALYKIGREKNVAMSLLAFSAMLAGVIAVVVLQVALIIDVLPFQDQLPLVLGGGSLLGLWYALGSYLARVILPKGLVRFGIATGGIIICGAVFFWIGLMLQGGSMGNMTDQDAFSNLHPLIMLGFMLVIISYLLSPIWILKVGLVFLRVGEKPEVIGEKIEG